MCISDYLKHLPPDSSDREDTEKALTVLTETAKHFEKMMEKDVSNQL